MIIQQVNAPRAATNSLRVVSNVSESMDVEHSGSVIHVRRF